MHQSFLDQDLDVFGGLLHEAWQCKRAISSKISSPEVDGWYQSARQAGALGGKITRSGGGGYLLLFTARDAMDSVRMAMWSVAASASFASTFLTRVPHYSWVSG